MYRFMINSYTNIHVDKFSENYNWISFKWLWLEALTGDIFLSNVYFDMWCFHEVYLYRNNECFDLINCICSKLASLILKVVNTTLPNTDKLYSQN